MKAIQNKKGRAKTGFKWFRHKLTGQYRTLISATALFVAGCIAVIAILLIAAAPQQYTLSLGEPAKETIKANKDIEDTITTQRLQQEAANKVEEVYKMDMKAVDTSLTAVSSAFEQLAEFRANAEAEWNRQMTVYNQELALFENRTEEEGETESVPPEKPTQETVWNTEFLDGQRLAMDIPVTNAELFTVAGLSSSLFDSSRSTTVMLLDSTLRNGVREAYLEQELTKIVTEVSLLGGPADFNSLITRLLKDCVKATQVYDLEATEANRQAAIDAVEPVIYKSGQNIVAEGELVYENHIAMAQELGLLKSESIDLSLYLGIALFAVLMYAVLYLYIFMFEKAMFSSVKQVAMLNLIYVIIVGMSYVMALVLDPLLIPVTLCAVLITALIRRPRLAIISNIIMACLASIAATGNFVDSAAFFQTFMTALVSGTTVAMLMRKPRQRAALLGMGACVGGVSMLVIVAMGLVMTNEVRVVVRDVFYALGSGILTGILALGTLPLWELAFKVATPMVLLELTDPNQPLLKRLLVEAPGTYHHCVIVGSLAEEAAEAIGGDGLLARVGANYHDVGKLSRPQMFAENQNARENPHDTMKPEVSAAIILAHPVDGLALAKEHKLPKQVQDIIFQHHGDSTLQFFYHRAVQMYGEENVNIEDYSYLCDKPRSKEAAIILLADTVEAALRSMKEHTPVAIKQRIRELVHAKLADGQLDNAELTMRDLEKICDAFFRVAIGVYHHRIAYPAVDVESMRRHRQEAKEARDGQSAVD